MLLLDTDVLIDVQRGNQSALVWIASLTEMPYVPGLVVMELIQDALNKEQVRQVGRLIAPLSIIWPSEADCQRALSLFSQLHLSHRLGLVDALIASTALGQKATLCKFNNKHYRSVGGLQLLQPYSRA